MFGGIVFQLVASDRFHDLRSSPVLHYCQLTTVLRSLVVTVGGSDCFDKFYLDCGDSACHNMLIECDDHECGLGLFLVDLRLQWK